ncbi:MAG: hypothetical protein FJ242_08740 [Nitrospira sp.]|nr:hypothetical protein [Nitrospira sp.]
MQQQKNLTNGPVAAAILSAGIGSMVLGLFTTLAEAIDSVKKALVFYNPVGPLSGKTTLAVITWLVSWIILGSLWKNKQVSFSGISAASVILIILGLIGTFPPFFEIFSK